MSPDPFPPEDPSRSHAEGNVVDPAVLAERRAQRAELAEQVAVRRAADAQALAAELSGERARLEAELEEARREPERLSRLVAERERALRTAEQRAHAEEAQRIETAEQLAAQIRRHEAELAELTARAERAEAEAAELAARGERAEAEASQRAAELTARGERAEELAEQRESELLARGERAEQLAAQREAELQALRVRLTDAEQIAAQAESARRRAELKRQSAREKRRRAEEAREQAEAELATLRAEAQAAREGADAVIAQAAHEQQERDRLRAEVEQVAAERAALRTELEHLRAEHEAEREQARAALDELRADRDRARAAAEEARAAQERGVAEARAAADAARAEQERDVAAARAAADAARAEQERGMTAGEQAGGPPVAGGPWVERLRAELACARALAPAPAARREVPWPLAAAPVAARSLDGALALERRLQELRGSGLPGTVAARAATGSRSIESALRQPAAPAAVASGQQSRSPAAGDPSASETPALDADQPAAPGGLASDEGLAPGAGLALGGGLGSAAARLAGDGGATPGRPIAEGGRVTGPPAAARTMPVTALALERERSTRLQAQLERQAETERQLRDEVAELQRAVASRMDAEQRIEQALRRVRGELEAANALRMLTERGSPTRPLTASEPAAAVTDQSSVTSPNASGPASAEPARPEASDDSEAGETALAGFDADRLNAARARLRASAPPEEDADAANAPADGAGPQQPADAANLPGEVPPADGAVLQQPADVANLPGEVPPADGAVLQQPAAPAAAAPLASTGALPAAATPLGEAAGMTVAGSAAARPDAAAGPLTLSSASLPVVQPEAPAGPPAPWLPAALRRLLADDPETAGRIVVGMLPAHGLVAQRELVYDLEIAERGTVAVDVRDGRATVRALERPRDGEPRDFRVSATHAGLARLLLGRRGLRRRARVRGRRRRVKELRRLTQEPLALRDLAASGATLEPALGLWLAALAIDPARTVGHRFTLAHVPLPGGAADAWLRIRSGEPPQVLRTRPGEEPAATLRCTRGALLALLAGVAPLPGEGGAVDGDAAAVALVRSWIRATEFPSSVRPPRRLGGR